ncbi:hypothetical protein [Chryseobacterium sp.]|uniref:hypothetical protein n=1 Tax=Chryseobacterium sp. TaxID=1871047 RepID=UPI002613E0D1|nr:hypothetical protein [Chryseobacterium sp.]
MKDCIITDKFIIDLTYVKTNFTEENPRFKDTFWTKYTLPVDIELSRDFKSKMGNYSSFIAMNLKKYHDCLHVFEGKLYKGKLEISNIRNKKIRIQVDSGFETLPNFDKKLNELPFEAIQVDDIYIHANTIVKQKYPETTYNFPKLISTDYNKDSPEWKYFGGFINNRIYTADGYLFPKNTVEDSTDVYNRNIIHPLIYILHILKVGFLDAGFILMGDILEDKFLKNRCVYSSEKYYTTGNQEYQKINVFQLEFYNHVEFSGVIFANWNKKIKVTAPGKYRLIGYILTDNNGNCSLQVFRDGLLINTIGSSTASDKLSFDVEIGINVDQAEEGVDIELLYYGKAINDRNNNEGVSIGVAEIQLNPIRQNQADGSTIPFIFNDDKIDLKKACPDMVFGEVVTTIKNWLNYELIFEGNIVFMNRIRIDKTKEPEDFRIYEIADPVRDFTEKQSFNLKFPKVEGLELDDIYYDESGFKLNKSPIPEGTTEIPINGFCLPLKKVKGVTTAQTYRENSLMLVYYEGLNEYSDNSAKNPPGMHGNELAQENEEWYMNRLTNMIFRWTFTILRTKLRKYNIRSEIFAYNKKHWIKSWVKNSVSKKKYSVEIETETF